MDAIGQRNTIINHGGVAWQESVVRACQMSYLKNCGDCGDCGGSGKLFSEDSRAIGYPRVSTYTVIKATGGYAPPARKRRLDALRFHDWQEMSRGLGRGDSSRRLARVLGSSASTIRREAARNKGATAIARLTRLTRATAGDRGLAQTGRPRCSSHGGYVRGVR